MRGPRPRLQLHCAKHVPDLLNFRRAGAPLAPQSALSQPLPATAPAWPSLTAAQRTLLSQGGFCSEVDYFPNASIAEFGRVVGDAAMMAGARSRPLECGPL